MKPGKQIYISQKMNSSSGNSRIPSAVKHISVGMYHEKQDKIYIIK